MSHLDVAGIDILYDTATACVGLDADDTVEVGAVHLAVFGKKVAATASNLATDNHTTMSVLHLTIADDDILAWLIPEASVVVASALHGDTVVTSVEETVFDEHAVA